MIWIPSILWIFMVLELFEDVRLMPTPSFKLPRKQNAPGDLFIDESCINCDVCRWICPSVYKKQGIKSIVYKQPIDETEKLRAYSAMISCPVGSIRLHNSDPLVKRALNIYPAEIKPLSFPGVFHMGYHSSGSFGACSYLINTQNDDGISYRIMIDTPRYNSKLADIVESEGGLDLLIITHKDNIDQHEKWKARFPKLQRCIHRIDAIKSADKFEILLEGSGPWSPIKNVSIIHTPGHTAGSLCIQYKSDIDTVLFTGDHLAYSFDRKSLEGFKRYNQGSVSIQEQSIRMLADDDYEFTWILPSHGRMMQFKDLTEKNLILLQTAEKFKSEDQTIGMFGLGYS